MRRMLLTLPMSWSSQMTSELTHLEKIDKAKKCFVWASTIDTNVRITKKEARALYIYIYKVQE
jgi:hypothetical protein